ncbi:MAG: hypothetical protein DRJ65_01665 [Acidobacteria bacterium]|nr:MAG: hypothetical protein DRJ65_01665 [Acidobacteriota bacterium]
MPDTPCDFGDNRQVLPLTLELKNRSSAQDVVAAFAVAAITLLVLGLVHGPIVLSPNQYAFSTEGEAIRNYFVLAYHAESDGGLHEFTGMNYPFGEQIVYSEGQPSLSYPLKVLSRLSPWFHEHAVGALNIFLLAGIAGSAALLLLILRRFGVGLVLSATSAIGLAMLAPQGSRLPWMFPQAFSAMVPIVVFLVIRIVDGGWTWRRVFPLMVANLFFLFLNPYPGVIAALFTTVSLAAALMLRAGRQPDWIRGGLRILVCTVLPVLMFFIYLRTTDHHISRPELPDGFFDFTAEFATIFGSFFSPLMPWIECWTGLTREMAWRHYEGNGYLGVFCVVVMVFALVFLVWRRVFGRSSNLKAAANGDNRLLVALAIGALCLSVFAAGIPFRWMDQGERWLTMLGPLAQFRCPGRFIWPLFYVANIVAVVAAARAVSFISSANRWRSAASIVVILGSGLMLFEGVAQHQWVAARGRGTVNVLNRRVVEMTPSLTHLKAAINEVDRFRYQAILTIPLFHIGSELLVPPSSFSESFLTDAFALAKHLQLPLISSMLGRISLEESLGTFGLYTPPYVAKDVCSQIGTEPILVLLNRDRALSKHEDRLAKISRQVLATDRFDLLELDVSQLCLFDQESVLEEVVTRLPSFEHDGGLSTDQPASVHLDTFNRFQEQVSMRGGGSLRVPAGELGWIFDTAALVEQPETGKDYVLDFWFFNRGLRLRAEVFVESNRQGGPVERHALPEIKRTFVHRGEWSLFSLPLKMAHSGQRIRLGLRSMQPGEDLVVDDLLLRAHDATVVWNVDETEGHIKHLVWNNHQLDSR